MYVLQLKKKSFIIKRKLKKVLKDSGYIEEVINGIYIILKQTKI